MQQWDGADNNVQLIPSGLCVIVYENGTQHQVTIIS